MVDSRTRHWRGFGWRLALVVVAIGLLILFGHEIGRGMPELERWIDELDILGPIVFAVLVVVLTTLLVPDTVLAIAAGVLFGFWGGLAIMSVACLVTAALNYVIARRLLRDRFESMTARHPKLQLVRRVADHGSVRLQFLLRLLPLSPVLVSSALAAAGVSFTSFMIAAPGILLGIAMEVYIGYAASHVTKVAGDVSTHSTTHTVLTIGGLIVSLIATALIAHQARRALVQAGETE